MTVMELRDRAVRARLDSRCEYCERDISEGEWIVKVETGWVHLSCAEEWPDIRLAEPLEPQGERWLGNLGSLPKANAELRFARGSTVVFYLHCRYPNAWWRFMQWACFGFGWRRLS